MMRNEVEPDRNQQQVLLSTISNKLISYNPPRIRDIKKG